VEPMARSEFIERAAAQRPSIEHVPTTFEWSCRFELCILGDPMRYVFLIFIFTVRSNESAMTRTRFEPSGSRANCEPMIGRHGLGGNNGFGGKRF